MPFPPQNWWMEVVQSNKLHIDLEEHFEKMSYRNKYKISGANNAIMLSIPLEKGRDQRTPVKLVRISNTTDWQVQHWRSLESAYRNTPYWEFYAPHLEILFKQTFSYLHEFNSKSIDLCLKMLKNKIEITPTSEYRKDWGDACKDLRNMKPSHDGSVETPRYTQIFEDRLGFINNLSILDLLMMEGPAALSILSR